MCNILFKKIANMKRLWLFPESLPYPAVRVFVCVYVCVCKRREKRETYECEGVERKRQRRVVWLYFRTMHFVIVGRGQTQPDTDKYSFFNLTDLREDPVELKAVSILKVTALNRVFIFLGRTSN